MVDDELTRRADRVDLLRVIANLLENSRRYGKSGDTGMAQVDIFHLHNLVTQAGGGEALSLTQVMDEVVPAFERARAAGKLRFLGLTGVGETAALHACVGSGKFQSIQSVYNMLNPSAVSPLPEGAPGQDYQNLFAETQAHGVGVVGIRVLAGGALSGSAERHPIASPPPAPIGSAASYDADIGLARKLSALVTQGHASSLTEAATRSFAS